MFLWEMISEENAWLSMTPNSERETYVVILQQCFSDDHVLARKRDRISQMKKYHCTRIVLVIISEKTRWQQCVFYGRVLVELQFNSKYDICWYCLSPFLVFAIKSLDIQWVLGKAWTDMVLCRQNMILLCWNYIAHASKKWFWNK